MEDSNPQHSAQTESQLEQEEDLRLEVVNDGPPLALVMPSETLILREAHRLASNKNLSVRDLAACVSQDPVLLIELLRSANSTLFSQDRPATTAAENAVVQLGSAKVIETINELSQRRLSGNPLVVKEFERLRSRSRRASIVARILAMSTVKSLAAEAQTVALVSSVGHMLACLHFGASYAKLASRVSRGTLAYRMLHEQSFNVHRIQMAYLRRNGFPEALLFALDRELACKTPHRMPLRHITEGAGELIDAYDADKWQKFSPTRELPPNSVLRFLRLEQRQYQKVWERAGEYLTLAKAESEAQALNPSGRIAQGRHVDDESLDLVPVKRETPEVVVVEIQRATVENLPAKTSSKSVIEYSPAEQLDQAQPVLVFNPAPANSKSENVVSSGGTFLFPMHPARTFEDAAAFCPEDKPHLTSDAAKRALSALSDLVVNVEKTQDLLEELLQLLISEGPFLRSGIFVVAEHGRSARLLRALGGDLHAGQEVIFTDPVCPLAASLNQIRSFNAPGLLDISAPLGVSAYALSPLNINNSTAVFLYADCGEEGAMSFESRRLFRYVVGLLNQILPTLETGLPA